MQDPNFLGFYNVFSVIKTCSIALLVRILSESPGYFNSSIAFIDNKEIDEHFDMKF